MTTDAESARRWAARWRASARSWRRDYYQLRAASSRDHTLLVHANWQVADERDFIARCTFALTGLLRDIENVTYAVREGQLDAEAALGRVREIARRR